MNNNNYNAGVPPTNAQGTASMSTRIESHIPGTQAHRERQFLEHENQAGMGATQYAAGAPQTNTGMNTRAPVYNNDVAPVGAPMVGPGNRVGMAGAGAVPTTHHGTTMGERAAELHGHTGPTGTCNATSATGTRAHMGDKVMGGMEAALGRATHNPVMEQKGWERKTFGDPKHRQDGLAHTGVQPVVQQQGYGPGGQPVQQGFTNPQAGYVAPTHPPAGY